MQGNRTRLALRRLTARTPDVARLQALLEQAPGYFKVATGAPAPSDAATRLMSVSLPPGKTGADRFLLGAFAGPTLVGCGDLLRGHPSLPLTFIGLLLVGEPWQRQGYGSAIFSMLREVVAGWNGCERLRLAVLRTNEPALRFWAKQGFTATGDSEPYLCGVGQTEALILERPL